MTRKLRRPKAGPPNLAARALGTKIFALKVLTPNKAYSRKVKHPKGSAKDEPLPFFIRASNVGTPRSNELEIN